MQKKTARKPANRGKHEKQDKPVDSGLFRDAVADVKPLVADTRAPLPKKVSPRAPFRRQEEQDVLHESLHGDFDPRDIDSADVLRFQRQSVGRRVMRKLQRGSFAVQAELDLHGMTAAEAQIVLRDFVSDSSRRGLSCIRIIHGKGIGSGERGPIVKRKVASLLRRWKPVLAFVSARQVDGGTGAVYVLLDSEETF